MSTVRFTKKIEQESSGFVVAYVFNETGKKVGHDFWSNPFLSQEAKLKKAHTWADKYIELCEKYVTPE